MKNKIVLLFFVVSLPLKITSIFAETSSKKIEDILEKQNEKKVEIESNSWGWIKKHEKEIIYGSLGIIFMTLGIILYLNKNNNKNDNKNNDTNNVNAPNYLDSIGNALWGRARNIYHAPNTQTYVPADIQGIPSRFFEGF